MKIIEFEQNFASYSDILNVFNYALRANEWYLRIFVTASYLRAFVLKHVSCSIIINKINLNTFNTINYLNALVQFHDDIGKMFKFWTERLMNFECNAKQNSQYLRVNSITFVKMLTNNRGKIYDDMAKMEERGPIRALGYRWTGNCLVQSLQL